MVTIGLVYMIIVILFGSLLVPFVILFPLIGLLMLIMLTGIVVTNVIMLRDLMVVTNATVLRDFAVVTNVTVLLNLTQHKIEAGADVRTALVQSGRAHMRPMLMTAAATILALIPLVYSTGGGLIAASLAIVVIGGLLSSTLLTLVVIPVIYSLLVGPRGGGAWERA